MPVPVTFADLTSPKTVAENKQILLEQLALQGFGALSWATGSVPSGLVEIQASALTDFQTGEKLIAEGGFNSTAAGIDTIDQTTEAGRQLVATGGDSLTLLSDEVYDDQRQPGLPTIGVLTLTDTANAGPYTFSATSTSFSIGPGGLLYNGVQDYLTGSSSVTVPLNGSRQILVQSEAVGSAYAQAGIGTINFFARGTLPGVTVTNASNWLTLSGTQQGTDIETDTRLRLRNTSRWATLGAGSPEASYVYWALTADQTVKRVAVFTNLTIFDPGTVYVILAGNAGAVSAGVVLNVQNYIAPNQVGGSRIPETARCVVVSAVNYPYTMSVTISVQAAYNTAAFRASLQAGVASYFAALDIGAFISIERVIEVLLYPAGYSPGVITDLNITSPSPAVDVQLAYNEVAVPTITYNFVSV